MGGVIRLLAQASRRSYCFPIVSSITHILLQYRVDSPVGSSPIQSGHRGLSDPKGGGCSQHPSNPPPTQLPVVSRGKTQETA